MLLMAESLGIRIPQFQPVDVKMTIQREGGRPARSSSNTHLKSNRKSTIHPNSKDAGQWDGLDEGRESSSSQQLTHYSVCTATSQGAHLQFTLLSKFS